MSGESQPGHIDHIKQINAGVVYRLIDQHGPVSRIELSKLSQLAPASITKIVREMMEAHLVRECQVSEAGNRGRPATGLQLECEGWQFLDLQITPQSLRMTLCDLSGARVAAGETPLPDNPLISLNRFILSATEAFFSRHQGVLERLTAITITLCGGARTLINPPSVDAALAVMLRERTGLSVYLLQDISALLLAEYFSGAVRGSSDIIELVVDEQIGAAVMSGGHLLHRHSPSIAETGHMQVVSDGRLCDCGNYGCLTTVASTPVLLAQALEEMEDFPESLLHVSGPATGIEKLCLAAVDGDRLATDIITRAGQAIGHCLAVMVNIFNPQYILINSPLNTAEEILFPAIENILHCQSLPAYSRQVRLVPASFSLPETLTGTALIKDALYRGGLLMKLLQG